MSDHSYMVLRERHLKERQYNHGGSHHKRALRDVIVEYKASIRSKTRLLWRR